jgi:hypothetical protein
MTSIRWLAAVAAFCLLALGMSAAAASEMTARPTASSVDIDHFWEAYDAAVKVDDPARQLLIMQQQYIDRGTPGLHAFMQAKGYTAQSYVDAIRSYPHYWISIRPHTLRAPSAIAALEPQLRRFQALYPAMRPASIYFAIGALKSGGTTQRDKVLIGAELATGDDTVDISEMTPKTQAWLRTYFHSRPFDHMELLVVHEFVHTQEHGQAKDLLGQSLYEGIADFVAEQVTGHLPPLDYVTYGPGHDTVIRDAFVRDMDKEDTGGWLYASTGAPFGVRDLGYYVGYAICQAYYRQSADKRLAIKQMIELNFDDKKAVRAFVDSSGYLGKAASR